MKFKIADDYRLCRYIEGDGYSSFMEGDVWEFNGFDLALSMALKDPVMLPKMRPLILS